MDRLSRLRSIGDWERIEGCSLPLGATWVESEDAWNFAAFSRHATGMTMFCAGDEFLNTHEGNNNPYNQDNETTWLDWSRLEQDRDIFRFFRQMIAFRKSRRMIGRSRYWREEIAWFGADVGVDLSEESRCLAWRLWGRRMTGIESWIRIDRVPTTSRRPERNRPCRLSRSTLPRVPWLSSPAGWAPDARPAEILRKDRNGSRFPSGSDPEKGSIDRNG